VKAWTPEQLAAAAGAELLRAEGRSGGPSRATIDSRAIEPGDLFVGLPGERVDGGGFAAAALEAGAWGVLVAPEHARELRIDGVVLSADDPLAALQRLARAWRRELGAQVIAITGSVGKTSTKDLTAALIGPHRAMVASRANFNTEIGLPLEVLAAPAGTEVLVLELAMRGAGQIAELTEICEPDVGVITNIGPVHLEILGSIEAIAAAKAELVAGLRGDATAVLPYDEPLLDPHRRDDLPVVTFGGPGADVTWEADGVLSYRAERVDLDVGLTARHQLTNALAAYAAARAVGVAPSGRVDVQLSALRGERVDLPNGAVLIDDCYNANPLSMRAALDDLAASDTAGRRVAVLGDMLELGPEEVERHREIGAHATASGVELLITVGPLAAAMLETFEGEGHAVTDAAAAASLAGDLLRDGDLVLVKASRGVGLERVGKVLSAVSA
jgi:UDP-N-acetylmuramoyl-tripeptide--D-alanyl-D-alanine ligase